MTSSGIVVSKMSIIDIMLRGDKVKIFIMLFWALLISCGLWALIFWGILQVC
jgi:hypothetical protein